MLPADFTLNSPGNLHKSIDGFMTFMPNALPPDIEPSWELSKEVSEADRAISELAGLARTLPNPRLLIEPFLRREAHLSSKIEGTQSSLSDLFYFEASKSLVSEKSDVREVKNYVEAMEYGLARLRDLPVSLRLIREIHERLMKGVRGKDKPPGEFRRKQNWIGTSECKIEDAAFVPPSVENLDEVLDAFEKYLHSKSNLPLLIKMALLHYQFEVIHPLLDGNGRIGRLLIVLLLCEWSILPHPILYLSAYFERNRQAYYDHLQAISLRGEWHEWITFFLQGIIEQSKDAIIRSRDLLDLLQKYRDKLQSVSSSSKVISLIDELFLYPVTSIPLVAKRLEISWQAAKKNIYKLVDQGILIEVTGRQRGRIYVAPEIINILETNLDIS